MKKTSIFLSTFMFLIVFTVGCKKDTVSTTNVNDLPGTIWVNKVTANGITIVETISFSNATTVSDIVTFNGVINNTYSGSGTYVYTPPSVKFIAANGNAKYGTINGNTLLAPSYDGTATVTYLKQ